MTNKKRSLSFEDSINRLEEIVGHLERGDLSLQESIRIFEEGNKLLHDCNRMLEEAEQKVVLLRQGSNGEAEEGLFEDAKIS